MLKYASPVEGAGGTLQVVGMAFLVPVCIAAFLPLQCWAIMQDLQWNSRTFSGFQQHPTSVEVFAMRFKSAPVGFLVVGVAVPPQAVCRSS